jgi:hypothetical protein
MVMKANMKFQPEEWAKLTPAHKTQLRTAKGVTSLPTTPREANSTTVTPIVTPIDSISVVTEVTNDSLIRQTLSNKAARTPNDLVNQLNYRLVKAQIKSRERHRIFTVPKILTT